MTPSKSNRTAWAQLYEARRISSEPESRSPGRPPAPIPRHKVGVTLSQAEIFEIESWQNRLSEIARSKSLHRGNHWDFNPDRQRAHLSHRKQRTFLNRFRNSWS